jgi:predicted RNA-binding Zn ribbon-like protein
MQKVSVETRRLVGGVLCLDFANSVDWASDGGERPRHTEVLGEPADLFRWGQRLGLVDPQVHLSVTGRELGAARLLRAAIHRVFAAVAARRDPASGDLALLAQTYAAAVTDGRLCAHDGWAFDWDDDDPRRIRFAVAVSAIELLRSSADVSRVRMCPGNNCGWLFLDTSGRRRWCSMEVCGSRAKMRRLYERQRQSSGSHSSRRERTRRR